MISLEDAIAITLFACWGSFLNVVAYRLLRAEDIVFKRSSCPHCEHTLAWYEMIPLFSWIMLAGKCRTCKKPISILYPFIELLTILVFFVAWKQFSLEHFLVYVPFLSALIISVRTDLESMLVSSYASLGPIPLAYGASLMGWLPISFMQSAVGTIVGYALLYVPARIYYSLTGKEGMGEGDFEMLAGIGAFTGGLGAWTSLLIASSLGSLIGIAYMLISKRSLQATRIPFAPFLALGAIIYVLFSDMIQSLLFL